MLFFLTLLVYTVPHIIVVGAVSSNKTQVHSYFTRWVWCDLLLFNFYRLVLLKQHILILKKIRLSKGKRSNW